MRDIDRSQWTRVVVLCVSLVGTFALGATYARARDGGAQAPLPVPPQPPASIPVPTYQPIELDRIVSPIALYPDPLLAQVLAAATFPADIPAAALWSDNHHYLAGKDLAGAITADHLPWDPSIQALLAFPSVLEMMASDMPWTQELGDAVLADQAAVMDAVQRLRQKAWSYRYLRSCAPIVVQEGPFLQILPADAGFIVVPYYDPAIVFVPPPPGAVLQHPVYCGYGIRIGIWLSSWGWGTTRIVWPTHTMIIHGSSWHREWAARGVYSHQPLDWHTAQRPPDQHEARPRTPSERARERPKESPGDGSGKEHHR